MKKVYSINLNGCDDNTRFNMALSPEEYELVKRIADKSEEVSTYICMPVLEVEEVNEDGEG